MKKETEFHIPRLTIKVFSGSAHPELGQEIVSQLNCEMGKVELGTFANGEIYVRFLESVRGADVFVIQTIYQPVNRSLMELLIMVDALRRASAERITAVIPHFGYARQDKKTAAREPITAKLVANLLVTAGVDRVITMDLHAGQIQGFFDLPVDHLTALPILADYFREKKLDNLIAVAPDVGRVKTVKKFGDILGAPLVILHKTRPAHNLAEITHVVGEVEGRTAVIVDDMIDTAGTVVSGARALIEKGVKEVYICATHGLFSRQAQELIEEAPIKEVVVTNTVPVKIKSSKIKVLSVARLLAQAISNVHEDSSVSELFKGLEY